MSDIVGSDKMRCKRCGKISLALSPGSFRGMGMDDEDDNDDDMVDD